jgi:hypothetical protein
LTGGGVYDARVMLDTLEVAQMLPPALRSTRGETTVIFQRHRGGCAACDQYLRDLDDIVDEFRVWEARLTTVESDHAALIVADRYGQIFHLVPADAQHSLPVPRELTEWIKHLGTLCPE